VSVVQRDPPGPRPRQSPANHNDTTLRPSGGRGRTRTPDQEFRKLLLYPPELYAQPTVFPILQRLLETVVIHIVCTGVTGTPASPRAARTVRARPLLQSPAEQIDHERTRQVPPCGGRGRRDDVDPGGVTDSRELRTRTVT